ncbi:MAG: tetratricopeptide repeat protein [Chitinophagales bacterium]
MNQGNIHSTDENGFINRLQKVRDISRFDPHEGIRMANKIYAELGNDIGEFEEAYFHDTLGRVYHWKGDFQASIDYFSKGLEVYQKNNHHEEIILTKNWLGTNYKAIGEVDKALELHLSSLSLAKKLNLNHLESRILTFIGVFYKAVGKNNQAIRYFEKALDASGPKRPIALSNLASVYSIKRDFPKALEYLLEAYTYRHSMPPFLCGTIIINTIMALVELGEFDQVISKIPELKQLKTEIPNIGFSYRYSTALTLIYLRCLKAKESKSAQELRTYIDIEELLQSLKNIVQSKAELRYRLSACELLNEYYTFHEDWKRVYEFQEIIIKLNSEKFEKERMDAIERLDIRYDVAKKEQKIQIQQLELEKNELELEKKKDLEKINLQLEEKVVQRTAKLSLQNQELHEFAFIVSHDLREPLCNIHGISSLLMETYQGDLTENLQSLVTQIGENAVNTNILLKDILDNTILNNKS